MFDAKGPHGEENRPLVHYTNGTSHRKISSGTPVRVAEETNKHSSEEEAEGLDASGEWISDDSSRMTPMPVPSFASLQQRAGHQRESHALELRGLTKRYGALVAVDALDLSINRGEIFGVLGPNGAGKTTTIQMICGLLKPDAGDIWVMGSSLASSPHLRRHIGVCPQQLVLWGKMTPLEQLVFLASTYDVPEKVARERALSMLEALGLWEKRDTLAKHLSGGMKRRLNLLMALIHEPSILVLDEPEAGLDPQSRVLVRDYVRDWVQGAQRTVILTSHNIDEVERLADRVAIMDRGRLLSLDTPDRLKRDHQQGDLLEIELLDAAQPYLEEALFVLRQFSSDLSWEGTIVAIRMGALVEHLSFVLGVFRRFQIDIQGLRMRPSTLEDVFISLTGRALRDE
ncbi:MAG: ABC transporter ATP-binding protein [Myxococcales bacterium]|nr:ABC transporter ATP-binding protein [Myxococcales bacterium]MCB9642744.1 ABC transporter ATP-binding protein [Myxococcales bacterium]